MAEMSPLRRRMIEDMTVRNLSPATQRSYLHAVAKFSRYFGRSPDLLGLEEVRAFQVHLVSTHCVARISRRAKSVPRAHCSCEANVFRPAKLQHAVERDDGNSCISSDLT